MKPLLLGALLLASCANPPLMRPEVYGLKRFALVSFCGSRSIDASPSGLLGGVFRDNAMGAEAVDAELPEAQAVFARAVGAPLTPLERVRASPRYGAWARPRDRIACAPGLLPVELSPASDAALAGLATDLGADAVIVVSNAWSTASDLHVWDDFRVVIVGANGARLWDEQESLDGARADVTLRRGMAQEIGALSPEAVRAMARSSLRAGLERFEERWSRATPGGVGHP